jgi:hypothetical protein
LDKLEFSINCNKFGFNEKKLFTTIETKKEFNLNNSIKYGEYKEVNVTIYLWKDNVDISDIIKDESKVTSTLCYNDEKTYDTYDLVIVNVDKQEEEAAAKKLAKEESALAKTTASNLKQFENTCVTLPYEISELLGSTTLENNVREIVTLSIGQAMSTYKLAKDKDISEQLLNSILKKLGLDTSTLSDASLAGKIWKQAHFTVKINVDTKDYGNQTIVFDVECGVGGFNSNSVQYSFGTITYSLTGKNKNKVPKSCSTGTQGGIVTYTNAEAYLQSVADYEISAIKKCFNGYLKNANQVAEFCVDSTTKQILTSLNWIWGTTENLSKGDVKASKKFASYSDGIWYIMTEPIKSSIKSGSSKCPVDLYIYDSENNLCGAIVDNTVVMSNDDIVLWVEGDEKYFQVCGDDYTIRFVGTDSGTMTYTIREYENDFETPTREIEFTDIPLEKNQIYYGYVPEQLYVNNVLYALTTDDENIIYADSDTLETNVEETVHVSQFVLSKDSITIENGQTEQLSYTLMPQDATYQDVLWSSSDETVATVDKEGNVTAVGEGTAKIVAIVFAESTGDECEIIVTSYSTGDDGNKDGGGDKNLGNGENNQGGDDNSQNGGETPGTGENPDDKDIPNKGGDLDNKDESDDGDDKSKDKDKTNNNSSDKNNSHSNDDSSDAGNSDNEGDSNSGGASNISGATISGSVSSNRENIENALITAFENGYTLNQVDLSATHILKASLLNQYAGQKMYIVAIMQPDFGFIIDMTQIDVVKNDIDALYNISTSVEFSPDFNTFMVKANKPSQLEFDAIFNFNVGEALIGKKAYVYMLNDTSTGYDLIGSTDVNSIGNVAFTSDKITDYIILVEK